MNTKKPPLRKKTISLPDYVLRAGLKRAKQDSRNFSSYVQKLINADSAEATATVERKAA